MHAKVHTWPRKILPVPAIALLSACAQPAEEPRGGKMAGKDETGRYPEMAGLTGNGLFPIGSDYGKGEVRLVISPATE